MRGDEAAAAMEARGAAAAGGAGGGANVRAAEWFDSVSSSGASGLCTSIAMCARGIVLLADGSAEVEEEAAAAAEEEEEE